MSINVKYTPVVGNKFWLSGRIQWISRLVGPQNSNSSKFSHIMLILKKSSNENWATIKL